ncbi:hypothetical protein mRhiFer1_008668 [Rhinolophus ferrumequinum]|uniref:DUF4817 domain-containing protein n=1 Tax=Rhinolophus ferrumequinum TaxID=59479 RepID=A0A7J7U115_RHIFE|nr:hypothetical protein mRhiFer1_008668 [Rhinolophus ferrumequinum]
MLASPCDRQDSQRKWQKHDCHFKEHKAILKWYLKFEKVVEVQRQWKHEYETEPPTRLTIQAYVISLRHMVLSVMCTREDPGGLAQQHVLLLLLWCWNSLHAPHRSLPNDVRRNQKGLGGDGNHFEHLL